MATKRTGHTGSPRLAAGYAGEREQRCTRLVARLDRAAASLNMTRAQFLHRYGGTDDRPPARPRRNGKAPAPDC
jgi:hypothetical protein